MYLPSAIHSAIELTTSPHLTTTTKHTTSATTSSAPETPTTITSKHPSTASVEGHHRETITTAASMGTSVGQHSTSDQRVTQDHLTTTEIYRTIGSQETTTTYTGHFKSTTRYNTGKAKRHNKSEKVSGYLQRYLNVIRETLRNPKGFRYSNERLM